MTQTFTPQQLERIQLWEQELRNPELHQGVGRLAGIDDAEKGIIRYCCLGVACEIAIANGLVLDRAEQRGVVADMTVIEYDGERDHLPEAVVEWYGFEDNNPRLCYIDSENGLMWDTASNFNDNDAGLDDRLSFTEIADAIWRTYLQEGDVEEAA